MHARPLMFAVASVGLLGAAGCARVSHLERFGGSTVVVHVDRSSPDDDLDSVRQALSQALSNAYVPAVVTGNATADGFLVESPYTTDAAAAVQSIIEQQKQRGAAIQLRLAHLDRSSSDQRAYTIPPRMWPGRSDSCTYARDQQCDEPRYCAVGTDWTDCHSPVADGAGRRST
jgi:hypothetical protein